MKKIIRLSFANIKKHKKESVLLVILTLLCIMLMSAAVSSMFGIKKITPSMVKESGCFQNFIYFNQENYSDKYLSFLEEDERVESYDHTGLVTDILKVKNYQDTGDDMLYDISFVPESGERRMETFAGDIDLSKAEHPIILDRASRDKLEVSEGDELTILKDEKEFTFTVAGFYDSGLWIFGSKAVISEEDYANLENHMSRYEMIGLNTVSGTDNNALLKEFKAFAEEMSVNDLTSAVNVMSYEDTLSMNETNMALLSIIIAIMAGVIVIAVMIMIRFRIVSDIKEQIVSIGVLEAIGYTSGDIALSYIAEYVLIALISAILAIGPAVFMAKGLLGSAAASVNYGGNIPAPMLPIAVCILIILLFVGLTAMTRALSVKKYPPVLAFRKGIEAHSFRKTYFPLEQTKGNIHIRLALKIFLQEAKNQIGLTVCITACTVMVLLAFMIGSFFSSPDRILGSVCGHELCDIRIQATGDIEPKSFAKELENTPEVEQVLLPATGLGVKANDGDSAMALEVYEDYEKTRTIILTQGRLPEHDNEAALSVQAMKAVDAKMGDTISLEYGKVKREYIVTGTVNSAVDPVTAYLTTEGFRRMDPAYMPSTFDLYLKEGADKNAIADLLKKRYGREIAEYKNDEVTGDTLEEKVKSAANIEMAKAMTEQGVSYMEYAIRVGDQVITGSTAAMKIKEMTFVLEENEEIAHMLCVSFAGISVIMMVISAVTVILMLAILMASTIRNQYRELGIMKGIGYTSKELMLQMAFRIIPVAVMGVTVGTVLAILLMQVVNAFVAKVSLSAPAILAMDLAILAFTFACAFISAGRIKKISVYELITE